MAPIYLDHQATTPLDPRVLDAMLPYLREHFGNAASKSHRFGWIAEEAVEAARQQIARAIRASPSEIVFTSGATEANNLAIQGAARAYGFTAIDRALVRQVASDPAAPPLPARLSFVDLARARAGDLEPEGFGDHLVTVATEHKSVLDTVRALAGEGFRIDIVGVQSDGRVSPEALLGRVGPRTILASVMAANNEVGVLAPLAALGAGLKADGRRALFHVDAAQAFGKIPLDVEAMKIDLMSISAHKIYGPKGVGALYVRRRSPRVRLEPLFHGGGHERGFRSGTLDVPGIVGLGKAAELALAEQEADAARLRGLAARLLRVLLDQLPEVTLNGHPHERLPGNLNLSFPGIEGEALMIALGDVAVSSGSACTSAEKAPSHVLRALGVPDDLAHGSLRFGLGRFTTEAEVDLVARRVVEKVRALRAANTP